MPIAAEALERVVVLDPLFDDQLLAGAMVELSHRHGTYRQHSPAPTGTRVGDGLAARHDSVRNLVRTGALGDAAPTAPIDLPPEALAARTTYFREEYASGGVPRLDGVQRFLFHDELIEAARKVHGRKLVEPVVAFANLLLPGQELAVHTDVPEFRGANRRVLPPWLLVVMHHSGLFDAWRLPIATGISYFQDSEDGALRYWPDGPEHPSVVHAIRHNTAVVFDADTIFHGVNPVGAAEPPPVVAGSELRPVGDRVWALVDETGRELTRYGWDELRFSVSWKAYCFADEDERTAWRHHADDLDEARIVDRLVRDLRERGVVKGQVAHDRDLGLLMIDTYVRFPAG